MNLVNVILHVICYSPCPAELSGSNRRSLRSVVKLHSLSLDTSTPVSSPAVWKGNQPLSPSSKKQTSVSNANGYHATRSSSSVKQPLEENSKMLLPEKESLEVHDKQNIPLLTLYLSYALPCLCILQT